MAKNLVIIESPGKISKIKEILGSDYIVKASVGHCVDLPPKKFAVNIKKNFEPTFEVLEDKKEIIQDLIDASKKSDVTYLFTDLDREGCAIAAHIAEQLPSSIKIKRLKTDSITKDEIKKALANPTDIKDDQQMVEAQLARRILDRICGYKTSFLTQMATGGRSAGRVQSAILRIIAEREEEIKNFKPEEFWVLTAYFETDKKEPFIGKLTEKIKVPNEKAATEIYSKVISGVPSVKSFDFKEVNISPYAPFTTMTLIASASTVLGWNTEKTMNVAQGLYSSGRITYHRTDASFISMAALQACRDCIVSKYGNKYLPSSPKVYASKKGAQEAHECCRPTDFFADYHLSGDDSKLYDLILKRTLASQMVEGVDARTKIVVDVSSYDFVSNGSTIIFDGYRIAWDYSQNKELSLPKLSVGEKVQLNKLDKEQKFTQPPPRFSDASLAKRCEDEQIARPATFKNFIKTLKDRGYIVQKGKSFEATELGIKVIDFLRKSDMCFVDIKYTAKLEELLDSIQEKKKTRLEVLTEFWERLQKDIEKGKEIYQKCQETEFECPKCKGKLRKKHSKFGAFYACSNYKIKSKNKDEIGCDYIANVGAAGEPIEKIKKVVEYADFLCNKCESKMVKRSGKFGDFYGCASYPKCKSVADLEGKFKEFSGKKFKKWKKKSS